MANTVDRRAHPRVSTRDWRTLARGRVRPGRPAHILDVSTGGLLLETDWRLLPGTRVELQLGDPVALYRVAGHILRCHISVLDRDRVRYRGAVAFEEWLHLQGGNE